MQVGLLVVGRSIGSAFSARFPVEGFRAELGTMLRKLPVAARALRAGIVSVLIARRG